MNKLTFFVMLSTLVASLIVVCSAVMQMRFELFIPSVYLAFVSLLGAVMSATKLDEQR